MADKLLKSIKFPTLPDRYVIGDSTLTEEGAAADAKAVGEALAKKADTKGRYEDLIVGGAEQLMADGYESDSEPYLFRPTGGSADVGNREYLDKIVGGTVAWNQLCNGSSVTVQNGHKYLLKQGTAWSIGASTGTAITGLTSGSDMVIDLTAMFGSTIADYIYSLEQATAGAGVAWFRNYFPKDYYPYDKGTLRSVEGVSAHEMVGFNQFDKDSRELLQNKITATNGNVITINGVFTTPFIRILPNTTYYCNHILGSSTTSVAYVEFDSDKNYIGVGGVGYGGNADIGGKEATFTTSKNARYIKFNGSLKAIDETNLNLSDPTRNGEYEPYTKHTYPLDSSLTLRGVPKLVDEKLAYDGDIYPPSGEVQRRYGIVDLGTLNWGYSPITTTFPYGYFYANVSGKAIGLVNFIASGYTTRESLQGDYNKYITGSVENNRVFIADATYADAASFKSAMSGVYMVYELDTPTTETAEGYEQYQICDTSGTEAFVTDSIVPVGHETRYPHDLKKKIETAPDSPSTDGTYLMKRSGGKNTYMALPSTPSANGAYVLTVTVSGGSASYSWTAKE